MGLLTTGVKYGAVFVAAREVAKAYETRKDKKHAQQKQHQPQPMQYDPYAQQLSPQNQPREASGSFHQVWCNRQCGGRCVAGTSFANAQMEIRPGQIQGDNKPPMD
ncbi:hypothetical protein LTR37_013373 [Vermiconidia calcicola]|uniref:Uncharacterized protein n=1 Tax=Vermiconidia calcicola TaxID=1690605 RepID=A0ACC3MYC0_9PEZI|nr:hypothetical protein LTR37_013373 [Vermiconidia calcicola]